MRRGPDSVKLRFDKVDGFYFPSDPRSNDKNTAITDIFTLKCAVSKDRRFSMNPMVGESLFRSDRIGAKKALMFCFDAFFFVRAGHPFARKRFKTICRGND